MPIPKSASLVFGLVGAAVLGWMLHGSAAAATDPRLPAQAASSNVASESGQRVMTSPRSDQQSPNAPVYITIVTGGTDPPDSPTPIRAATTQALAPTARASTAPIGQKIGPDSAGLSIVANGDHIVIANDRSIVLVGDNGTLKGITGDAAASASIAMDVENSDLSTGNSQVSSTQVSNAITGPPKPTGERPIGAWRSPIDLGGRQAVATGSVMPSAPLGAMVPQPAAGGQPPAARRAVGIAGYENRSLDVAGTDNTLTYDNSEVFLNRIGQLNGNTGDTYASGLNVVDAKLSTVRSGDSRSAYQSADPPPLNAASSGSPSASGSAMPSTPMAPASSVSIADSKGVATATADDTLVIGGSGVHDQGVRMQGDRNVSTYDNSNAAIGGIGDVNAQMGNSETSGAVAMAVTGSTLEAGGSFLTASRPPPLSGPARP